MKRGIAIALVALGAVIVQPLGARAVGPDPNLKARSYSTAMVQAMDQCTSAITNVGGVGACAPSNSSTDGTPFTSGNVSIRNRSTSSQVKMLLKSSAATPPGALAGKSIHLVIVLRVTRTVGTPLVTWLDRTLDCPSVTVPPSGNVSQKTTLASCGLVSPLSDDTTNKEVLSAQVVDSTSGKPIAVPGVRNNR